MIGVVQDVHQNGVQEKPGNCFLAGSSRRPLAWRSDDCMA